MKLAKRWSKTDPAAKKRKRLEERRYREQLKALNSTFGTLPNLVVPSRNAW